MNVSLAKEQMDAILAHLPREAILAFEVGNEVGVPHTVPERLCISAHCMCHVRLHDIPQGVL